MSMFRKPISYTAPTTAPELDWETFQQYLLPAIYSGDPRAALDGRGQWSSDLGWDVGGKGSFSIEGLDRDAFFSKYVPEFTQGYGDNAGSEASTAWDAAYGNPEAQAAWRDAVDQAVSDPSTRFVVRGDRLVEQDGSAATGKRSGRQVQYDLVDGKLVPIGQNDFERSSAWADFRDQGLPVLAGVLGAGYGLNALGIGGNAATTGALSGYTPANAAGALGGVGSPTTTAGFQLGEMAGSLVPGGTTGAATNAALIESAIGTPGYGLSSAGLGGGAAGIGGLAPIIPSATNATNAALIESAINTPGYGLSSAGAGLNATEAILAGGSALPSWLTKAGETTGDWLGKVWAGDPAALRQLQLAGSGLGLLGSLTADKPKAPTVPVSKYNDWAPAQKTLVDSYFNSPRKDFEFIRPTVFAPKPPRAGMADGGGVVGALGMAEYGAPAGPGYVEGEGGGQDDVVPINASAGEYVFDADIVAALGDGSNEEGARRLDEMREQIRRHKRGAPSNKIPPRALPPLAYLGGK